MTSIIELILYWCSDTAPDADDIAVRIYRNGHLIAREERRSSGTDDMAAFSAANTITGFLLGRARREKRMECRNRREVK